MFYSSLPVSPRFLVLTIWLAPFIMDRIKWSEPKVCIWEPSRNEEFVVFIAVVGHHLPCTILTFCYIRVFQLTRVRIKVAPSMRGAGAATSTTPSSATKAGSNMSSTVLEAMTETKLATTVSTEILSSHHLKETTTQTLSWLTRYDSRATNPNRKGPTRRTEKSLSP